jgi:hypothetical protein
VIPRPADGIEENEMSNETLLTCGLAFWALMALVLLAGFGYAVVTLMVTRYEAVRRGYAEWVLDAKGRKAGWRWKPPVTNEN